MSLRIMVLYGTESGNAQYCAEILGDKLSEYNIEHTIKDMGHYEPSEVSKEQLLFIITSTHGNGDPPANAEYFLEYLNDNDLDLSQLKYAVCGLGDSSFSYFAQCGKDFDEILFQHKAQRIIERVDCDADYDDEYDFFMDQVLTYLKANG